MKNPAALLASTLPAVPPQETPEAIMKFALPHQPYSALLLFHFSAHPASTLTRMWKKCIQKWKWHEDRGRLHTHNITHSREMNCWAWAGPPPAGVVSSGLVPGPCPPASAPPAWPPVHLNTASLLHPSMYNIGKIKLVLYRVPKGCQCHQSLCSFHSFKR